MSGKSFIDVDLVRKTFAMHEGNVTRVASQCGLRGIGGYGYLRRDGYREHCIGGRLVLAHHIAFVLAHGRWPQSHLDHIDRNRSNNDPANLREVTYAINRHNSRLGKNNTVGLRGVSLRPNGKYRARIRLGGKCLNLGDFESPWLASEAYRRVATKVYTVVGELSRTHESSTNWRQKQHEQRPE